ncbi:glycerophosphoryl diester phosphodiesterase [Paenibacillus methanolicus]|uniref:Glycerophosphoryl diester phosphodiesterase n=2 Tax=Paenibacillus methanolicus TaxID=582686 RepID=A0A5S5CBK2_9BACL|nr:glycerophosphoryl diester phosphodiesterase [Paenibacillus methanolicus]
MNMEREATRTMRKTMVAAHTGCGIHPDNTMASFREGIQIGADIVEVDVRVTHDGTPILLHDDSPYLHTHTYAQLNQPDIRSRLHPSYQTYEIATLEQVLRESGPLELKLNLDLKSIASIEPTVQWVRKFHAQKRVYITGCSDHMTKRYPDMQVMLNTPDELLPQQALHYAAFADSVCREAKEQGYAGLNMNGGTCRQQMVDKAHALGLKVWVYTINEPQRLDWFATMGVDAITTRKPGRLFEILRDC